MRRLPLCLLPLLAACAAPSSDAPSGAGTSAEPVEAVVAPFVPPPGYPPKLGTAQLNAEGTVQIFTTYDFSVGAFDASAWFDSENDVPRFTLTGYPGENPDAETGLLRVTAHLPNGSAAGSAGTEVLVEIWQEGKRNGAKLTSVGHPASLVLDSFTQESDGTSGYGHASGRFTATLCPGAGDPAQVTLGTQCHEVSGSFDTGVQYSP
jgi:hypothetical protein